MCVVLHLVVTPYVGVWIETTKRMRLTCSALSLLMWECGLKPNRYNEGGVASKVTPYVGVWIETPLTGIPFNNRMSLLMWECGLKLQRLARDPLRRRHSLCGSVD